MHRVLWVLLVGCSVDPQVPAAVSHVEAIDLEQDTAQPIDLVVVVDRSAAMDRTQLATALTTISTTLEQPWGQNYRIGVTTADPADGAAFVAPYLTEVSLVGKMVSDFDGPLAAQLITASQLEPGSDLSMPLDALAHVIAANPSFHRDGAAMWVAILASRDDQSTTAVADVAAQLADASQPFGSRVLALSPQGGPRLEDFAARTRDHSGLGGSASLAEASVAERVFGHYSSLVGPPCLQADLAQPLDCSLHDEVDGRTSNAVPACDAAKSNAPCFTVLEDANNCSLTSMHQRLVVHRLQFPAFGTRTRGQCATF